MSQIEAPVHHMCDMTHSELLDSQLYGHFCLANLVLMNESFCWQEIMDESHIRTWMSHVTLIKSCMSAIKKLVHRMCDMTHSELLDSQLYVHVCDMTHSELLNSQLWHTNEPWHTYDVPVSRLHSFMTSYVSRDSSVTSCMWLIHVFIHVTWLIHHC